MVCSTIAHNKVGDCAISVEVAGPNLPSIYMVVPDTVHSLASHLINECIGRAGREGGFATLDIGKLIDLVVNPSSDLDQYRKRTSVLKLYVEYTDAVNVILSSFNYLPHSQRHKHSLQTAIARKLRPFNGGHACWCRQRRRDAPPCVRCCEEDISPESCHVPE